VNVATANQKQITKEYLHEANNMGTIADLFVSQSIDNTTSITWEYYQYPISFGNIEYISI
jgi:hypothetical protein